MVALARLACYTVAIAFPPRCEHVGDNHGTTAPLSFGATNVVLDIEVDAPLLPARYGVSEISLWDCLSHVVMCAPQTLHTVRCDMTSAVSLRQSREGVSSLVLGSNVDPDTLLAVWCAALRNRDAALVERVLHSVCRGGVSSGKRRREVDLEHPIWSALRSVSLGFDLKRKADESTTVCGENVGALRGADILATVHIEVSGHTSTVRKADRGESVPLFPSTFVAAAPSLTAPAHSTLHVKSNGVPLFYSDSHSPASQHSDPVALDEELLQQVIDTVTSALDDEAVPRCGSLQESKAPSTSTTESSAPSSRGDGRRVGQQPRLLSLGAPSSCLANREKLSHLASQLQQAQQARKDHLHKFTSALLDEVRSECLRLQVAFRTAVDTASKPLLDEVSAMRRTRDDLVQKSRESEAALASAGRSLEALLLRCMALCDEARNHASSCQRAISTLDIGIAAAMDALQSNVLPSLQQQRHHSFDVLAKKMAAVVEELQRARSM